MPAFVSLILSYACPVLPHHLFLIHQVAGTFSLDYSVALVAISVVAYTVCCVLTFVSTTSLKPAIETVVVVSQAGGSQTTVVQTSSTMMGQVSPRDDML